MWAKLKTHIQTQVKKARQRNSGSAILKTFYSGAIESVLTQFISVWNGNGSSQDCKALQRVVRLAECISGSALHSLQHIYLKRCKSRADKIIKVTNHPGNCLLILLTSGKRFRSLVAKTERLRRSFFPQAIRLLNSNSHNINMTPFNNHLIISKIFIILYHSYCCYVNTLHNLFAHC